MIGPGEGERERKRGGGGGGGGLVIRPLGREKDSLKKMGNSCNR